MKRPGCWRRGMHQQPGYWNGNKRSAVRKFDPGFPVTYVLVPDGTCDHSHRLHAPRRGLSALRRDLVIWMVALVHARRAPHPLRNLRSVMEGWRDYRAGRLGERGADEVAPAEPQPALVAQGTADAA